MEVSPTSPGPAAAASPDGRAAPLCVAFILDIVALSRRGGDLLQPLLLTAILEANQSALRRDPQLQRLYADATTALPDALRRPVSINATAQSLGLPFETVRRRVGQMRRAGLCVVTPAGVYVPEALVLSAEYQAIQAGRVARLGRLAKALVAVKALESPLTLVGGSVAARAADRAIGEYILRVAEPLMRDAGGAMNAMVLLGVWHGAASEGAASGQSLAALQARLAAPRETVRRHLEALAAADLVRRTSRGWIADSERVHAAQRAFASENLVAVRRLFARLAELGRPTVVA
jgi:DNA-binding Lrp family transcriptional regulator